LSGYEESRDDDKIGNQNTINIDIFKVGCIYKKNTDVES
jgi:hypothetical protein